MYYIVKTVIDPKGLLIKHGNAARPTEGNAIVGNPFELDPFELVWLREDASAALGRIRVGPLDH